MINGVINSVTICAPDRRFATMAYWFSLPILYFVKYSAEPKKLDIMKNMENRFKDIRIQYLFSSRAFNPFAKETVSFAAPLSFAVTRSEQVKKVNMFNATNTTIRIATVIVQPFCVYASPPPKNPVIFRTTVLMVMVPAVERRFRKFPRSPRSYWLVVIRPWSVA